MDRRAFERRIQRRHLELFLEWYFGAADVNPCFDDKPDLLIESNDMTIGIEHTRYFLEPSGAKGLAPKAQEELQNEVVWKAWQLFQETSKQPLWVAVEFEQPTTYRRNDVDLVAQALVTPVQRFLHGPYSKDALYGLESWRAKRSGEPWPDGISRITIKVESGIDFDVWTPSRSYAVPHLHAAEIQKTIDRKNKHVPDYLQRCSQVWLLIAFDDGSQSSHFDVGSELLTHWFSSKFAKTPLNN